MRCSILFMLTLLMQPAVAQERISVGVTTNIRALAVNDSLHWWFGGSGGWLGHTADGGKSWELRQPAGSAVDFRSIHAFNQQEAVAAIAGQPAQIYRTQDGGKRWELVHWLKDTTAFIDAIGFWNAQDGLLFGDPLPDGRMLLLQTSDGGRSWEAMPLHCLLEGVPHDGILFLGWVGYPYAEDIVDESFVEGDMLGPLREEGVFV